MLTRGGLGWGCASRGISELRAPLTNAVAAAVEHPINLQSLDIGPLATLTLGMLGLGRSHVAKRANGEPYTDA